ncbi:MAG TPA: MerR family transcriptional regulator [Frankiaceae bacterium]|jgi:DNA-binding transcriptional MerR regulator|nr:MerR family transcriptional regulator [Frankiaceae bacterium]
MTNSGSGLPGAGLLIGDAARLCGVTPRAVRHYHDVGLLPEPSRDSSGYRRYGAADVIALVRISRLRALGMPVPQIARRLGGGSAPEDLRRLADELGHEIDRLGKLRDRIVAAIGSQTLDPAEVLARALREFGQLGAEDELDPGESEAASLVDALHPGGIAGALDTAHDLLASPSARARFDGLLQRYRALSPDSTPAEIEGLAADVMAALPRPENAPVAIDVGVMDALVGDRLNAAQRRFMTTFRAAVAESDE